MLTLSSDEAESKPPGLSESTLIERVARDGGRGSLICRLDAREHLSRRFSSIAHHSSAIWNGRRRRKYTVEICGYVANCTEEGLEGHPVSGQRFLGRACFMVSCLNSNKRATLEGDIEMDAWNSCLMPSVICSSEAIQDLGIHDGDLIWRRDNRREWKK